MAVPRKDLRILVVDDRADDLEYFVRVLARAGYRAVDSARSAEEAMEILEQGRFALLVTDLWMPGMNGDELGLWAKERQPDLEVIIITAEGSVDTASKAVRFGASDYLSKPLEGGKVILQSIDRALDKYQERTRNSEQLKKLQSLSDIMSDVLDRLPQGVILVDSDCKLRQVNNAAQKILERKDGLQLDHETRLAANQASDTGELRAMVLRAAEPRDDDTGWAMTILRPKAGTPMSLMVTPSYSSGEEEPVVSVFVVGPEHPPLDEGMLCKLYGMTPAEARLAAHLARGRSLDRCRKTFNVTLHTVRSHLKNLSIKTETSGQVELVHKLLTGPAALTGPPDDTAGGD